MKKRFLITFIISLAAFGFLYSSLWSEFLEKETIAAPDGDIDIGYDDIYNEDAKTKIDGEILFLLTGVDSNDVKDSKGTRTDTMMLVKVDFKTGAVDLLSIPRDTRVAVRGQLDKINHAHAYGGTSLTMETVRDFLNIDLDYYVKVDYKVVKGIVDAIGGVEVDVPQRMLYSDPTAKPPLYIDLYPGVQVLDGQNAHDFLRFRSYKTGDLGRIEAQQYFMKELMKQTLKPRNILRLPKIVETYFDNVETNIPLSTMLKGVSAARKIDVDNMNVGTIPGDYARINGLDYWIYDEEGKDEVIREMFGDYLLDR